MKTTKPTMNFEQNLREQLQTLPRDKLPERDLWKGIELGLEAEPRSTGATASTASRWVALAASVALVASLSWIGIQEFGPSGQTGGTGTDLVQALSQQHETQKQALLVQFDGQPALTENWQQQLAELDDAAKAIKTALAEDPNNTALLRMLQNVYQQQITLIERVHAPKWQQI